MNWLNFKKIILSEVLNLLFVTVSLAGGGGWSSGGGEILRNAHNPWFLKNTLEVKYCILEDASTFSDIPLGTNELVKRAIRYWQNQFEINAKSSPTYSFGQINIATQKFIEVPCGPKVDIHFQFGVLTKVQQDYLVNPKKYLGIAVRTNYDEVQLKGNGFIYISPDSGTNAYEGYGLSEKAWHLEEGGLLYRVLIHELGHIFGIPHMSTGIMTENYPETIVKLAPIYGPVLGYLFTIPNFFSDPTLKNFGAVDCGGHSSEFKKFLNVSKDTECLRLLADEQGNIIVDAKKRESDPSPYERLGTFELGEWKATRSEPAIKVSINERQKVFSSQALDEVFGLFGPQLLNYQVNATFKSESVSKPAIMLKGPGYLQIGGVIDGKIVTDLYVDNSPSMIAL
jgi:hypothetical protein